MFSFFVRHNEQQVPDPNDVKATRDKISYPKVSLLDKTMFVFLFLISVSSAARICGGLRQDIDFEIPFPNVFVFPKMFP